MRASGWDDKIGYFADLRSASLNAFLGGSLKGMHNAIWRELPTKVGIFVYRTTFDASIRWFYIQKSSISRLRTLSICIVGMTRFELATTRPPDVYSNRAELHPATLLRAQR